MSAFVSPDNAEVRSPDVTARSAGIILTTGHPRSGCTAVQRLLGDAGLAGPSSSRSPAIGPVPAYGRGNCEIVGAGVTLDAEAFIGDLDAWQKQVVELLNASGGDENWGWADSGATWALDCWLRCDRRARVVALYRSPWRTAALSVGSGSITTECLTGAMNSWIDWNTHILRFAVRHSDRCVLINTDSAVARPELLVQRVSEAFSLNLGSEGLTGVPDSDEVSVLAPFFTEAVAEVCPHAVALYRELQSAAHLAEEQQVRGVPALRSAWQWLMRTERLQKRSEASIRELQMRCEELELTLSREQTACEKQTRRAETLEGDRRELQERCDRLGSEISRAAIAFTDEAKAVVSVTDRLETVHDLLRDVLSRESASVERSNALSNENVLLAAQVGRLQCIIDECETDRALSLAKIQELSTSVVEAKPYVAPAGELAEVTLDMRRNIEGKNWYWAEHDGRWAGPASESTVRFPAMGPGRYEVSLNVAGAMDTEILAGMHVAICDQPVALTRERRFYPTTLNGCVTLGHADRSGTWEIRFEFPRVSSPADDGSTDARQLAIRLRSIRLRLVSDDRIGSQ